jgi:large subunit ribosomal protein L15
MVMLIGMGAGLPDFVVVNLSDLEKNFAAGAEVTLEAVKDQVLSVSGREASLPLKVRVWLRLKPSHTS